MAKVRVYELAKELGLSSKQLLGKLNDMGEFVRSASSTIEAPVVRRLRDQIGSAEPTGDAKPAKPAARKSQAASKGKSKETPSAKPTPGPKPGPAPKPAPGPRPGSSGGPKPGRSSAARTSATPRPGLMKSSGGSKKQETPAPKSDAKPAPKPGQNACHPEAGCPSGPAPGGIRRAAVGCSPRSASGCWSSYRNPASREQPVRLQPGNGPVPSSP